MGFPKISSQSKGENSIFLEAFLKYGDLCGWFWSSLYSLQRSVRGLPERSACNDCGKIISRSYPGFASKKAMTPLVVWSCPNGCDVENYPESFRTQVISKSEDFRGLHVLGEPDEVVKV